jgi:hypothetical protein
MYKKPKKERQPKYEPKLKVKGTFLDLVKLSIKDEKKKEKKRTKRINKDLN